jgi:ribonuclease P protein component
MLPKKQRIPRELFTRILAEGKRYNSPSLLLYVANGDANSPSRFAFSVSKKVCKKAVDRNKFRRRGYSVIGKHIKNTAKDHLCFFSFKKSSSSITFEALEKEIVSVLRTASVLE